MINYSNIYMFSFFFKFTLFLNVFVVTLSIIFSLIANFFGNVAQIKDKSNHNLIKNFLVSNIVVNIFIASLFFYFTLFIYKQSMSTLLIYNAKTTLVSQYDFSSFYSFDFDLFNLLFYIISLIVGFIALLTLDTRLYSTKLSFLVGCNFLILTIFLFSFTKNFILFFLFYELLLIPSFFFVYKISPAKTAAQSSIYFIIWTQIGSFLVFLAIMLCAVITKQYTFSDLSVFNFTTSELVLIQFLLFIGFGIKIPIWPFHYWITKTHVDAPTGFSIFLSGFLVKTALFGFYKFIVVLGYVANTTAFATLCLIGIIDASIKMWGQTDLKKLVAYATIQEMSLVFLTLCFGDTTAVVGGFIFSVTHALLSSLFFFLVDTITRRFYTRNIVEINGLLHLTPNLGITILVGCVLYSGLPGTLKFVSELYIFTGLVDIAPLSSVIVLFIANFIGLIGFSKIWFNVVFGMTTIRTNYMVVDLSYKEIYTISICYTILVLWGLVIPVFL